MRSIARVWSFALIIVLLAPWAGAQPESTEPTVSAEVQDLLSQEAATESALESDSQSAIQDQSFQPLDLPWFSPQEPTSAAEVGSICSGNAPPSCQCGSCCECYTCWVGPVIWFGCDV